MPIRLCIINGYPKPNREVLTRAGMCGADELYVRVLKKLVPDARLETLFIADLDTSLPAARQVEGYDGFIWTGSNLTIYEDDPRVARQIRLTAEGRRHPMYEGKPDVFDGFISHLDEVTRLPDGGVLLATNEHTRVQALEVRSGQGVFWATQYHPEYELAEMARLIVARADSLIKEGFFADRAALEAKVHRMEALASDPSRKDLRWDVAVEDDILDDQIRQCELRNWVRKMVMPATPAGKR